MTDRPSDDELFGELEEDELSTGFKRSRKGVVMQLPDDIARVIKHVLGEMLVLLAPDESAVTEQDPLAAAVGIGTSTSAPSRGCSPTATPTTRRRRRTSVATPSRVCATRSARPPRPRSPRWTTRPASGC